jgi:hypothetical protein
MRPNPSLNRTRSGKRREAQVEAHGASSQLGLTALASAGRLARTLGIAKPALARRQRALHSKLRLVMVKLLARLSAFFLALLAGCSLLQMGPRGDYPDFGKWPQVPLAPASAASVANLQGSVLERRARQFKSLFRVSLSPELAKLSVNSHVDILRPTPNAEPVQIGIGKTTRQIFDDHLWILVDDAKVADNIRAGDFVVPWQTPTVPRSASQPQ